MVELYERRGEDVLANQTTTNYQVPGQITYLADGRLLIVWQDESSGVHLRGRIYNADGSAAGDELVLTSGPAIEVAPFAFALPNGGFVVAWSMRPVDSEDWDVGAQIYGADGSAVGGPLAVHAPSPVTQGSPAGAALADGGFVITWHDFGAEPASATFQSEVGVMAQRFDASGAAVGGVTHVNSSPEGGQGNPSVAALADGGWIVVWDDFGPVSGIAARRYAADGSPAGGDFLVSAETAGTQQHNVVAALPGGGFVVAWTGRSADGSASAVRARLYGADGAPLGDEFIVNQGTEGLQSYPAIAALASGDFVISWRDGTARDGSGAGVRAQVFEASGARIGDEFVVNTTTAGAQYLYSAAAYGNEFTVAWADYSGLGGDADGGVRFARFVAAPGTEGDDTLTGTVGADEIHGFGGNDAVFGLGAGDFLYGGDGDDVLEGGEGDDTLESGAGVDTLRGGDGDDRLIVLSGTAGELDTAEGGAGTDRLEADFAAAGAPVTLSVAAGAGGGLDGWVGAGADAHALEFSGIEELELRLSGFADEVTGSDLGDTLRGMGGDDVLNGAGGDDVLDGGTGADRMAGGAGDDSYQIDDPGDTVVEERDSGSDTVVTGLSAYRLGLHVENLTGSDAAQTLTGNTLSNVILGGGGNDRIEDRDGGDDRLDGGAGDDILILERTARPITTSSELIGGAGNDDIRYSGGVANVHTPGDWARIEAGDGDDRVSVTGRATVILGAGKDVLTLGGGGLAYVTDFSAGTDRLDFHAFVGRYLEGWDQEANPFTTGRLRVDAYTHGTYLQIKTGSGLHDYTNFVYLAGIRYYQVEQVLGGFTESFTAPPATTTAGTEAGETLYGTAGADTIDGLGGDDRVESGFGNDTLSGGEGDDYLNGQTGHDTLFGGAGNDRLIDDAGGGDTLRGEDGNDYIEALRAPAMVKRTLTLDGGAGDDEIVYTQLTDFWGFAGTGFTVVIDAGEGADLVRLAARSGTTTVTLGAGADTLRLGAETGGAITVTDFEAGPGGDRLDLAAYLAGKLSNWNQADNPFATGHLSLVAISATEAALRVDANGGGDGYVLLATLKGADPLSYTAENFGGYDPAGGAVAAGIVFAGTPLGDAVAGTIGADTLHGLDGDDDLFGGLGDDQISGGGGQDRLSGGGGDDGVWGGDGNDLLEDVDGGDDLLFGDGGDDRIVILRAAAGTPGATAFASGGDGADRIDITGWSAANLTIDGGAGDDVVRFFKLMGGARVTLGDGRDVIRLEPEYFGPHTNQTQVKEIVVTDFATGAGGDFLDLKQALAYGAMHWPDDDEGLRNGSLRLVQDGADTLLQYTYSSSGPYQTLFRFEGRQASDFTRDNLDMDVPTALVIDQAGAEVVNEDDIFGVPAVRITGEDVRFTNAAGGSIEGIGFFTPGGVTISIEAAGATLVNEAGGQIRGTVLGSAFADTVENFGVMSGPVTLGDGDDHYFERFTGLVIGGTLVDLGAGDDSAEIELTTTFLHLSLVGGAGHDILTIRDIAGNTRVTTYVSFASAGFEQLNLHGTAGASIEFGGHPAVGEIHVHDGVTLIVPNRPSGSQPYTLAPAGTVYLHGGNLTAGLNWSFKTIVGSAAAETVILVSNFSLAAGTTALGVESVSLGGGDDRLHWGGSQPKPGSADGGDGQDWLTVDLSTAALDLSTFTGFETVEIRYLFLPTAPAVRKIGPVAAGTERLLFANFTGNPSSLIEDQLDGVVAADLAIGAGSWRLTILANSTVGSLSDRYLIDPTTIVVGVQQVENRGTIVGAVDLGGGNDKFVNYGSVGGNVDLGEGNDQFTGAAGGGVGGVVRGGLGDDLYILEAAGYGVVELSGEGVDEVRTALATYALPENVENLTATGDGARDFRGNGGDNVITGAAGSDLFQLQDGGDDTASGGAGNDAFYMGAALSSGDRMDGGTGSDQIGVQGDYRAGLTLGAGTLVGIESLVLISGSTTRFGDSGTNLYSYAFTTVDGNVAAGQRLTVTASALLAGENLTFDGSAESDGSFLFYGGQGVDTLNGGALADAFFFGSDGRFAATDSVDGGGGNDQVGIRGDYSTQVVFTADTIQNVESLVVLSDTDLRYGAGGSSFIYNFKSHDGNVAAGQILVVTGTTLRATEQLRFDGAAETDGRFDLRGGAGGDVLTGGSGNDQLFGGLGADILAGGGGSDVFLYRALAESTAAAMDSILDFAAGDAINLGFIDADATAGGNQAFAWIGGAAFTAAGQLRGTQNGNVWTIEGDVDGDGTADLVIQVTTSDPAHLIGAGDFVL